MILFVIRFGVCKRYVCECECGVVYSDEDVGVVERIVKVMGRVYSWMV